MDWTMVGALGEIIGAAAVVVSLLYVGRELKHSSAVARLQGIQSTNEKLFEWAMAVGTDPDMAALMLRVEAAGCGCSDFTEQEQARIAYVYHALLSLTHTIYERRTEGLITDHELDRWAAQNAGVMGSSYLCEIWPRMRPTFASDYARWLEARFNLPAPALPASRPPAGGVAT